MQVSSPSGGRVRSWTQVLNLRNGTYIGRFRMYDYAGDIRISIKHSERDVAKSPFIVKGLFCLATSAISVIKLNML